MRHKNFIIPVKSKKKQGKPKREDATQQVTKHQQHTNNTLSTLPHRVQRDAD